MDKGFKVHLIEKAKDYGTSYRIGIELKIENNSFWYYLNMDKRYFIEVHASYVRLKPEARDIILKALDNHSYSQVRYNAKYYPDKVKIL